MASRYTKKELKDSLYKGISLVERSEDDWKWVTYNQLPEFYDAGYRLLNEDKRKLYEKGRYHGKGKEKALSG